MDLSVKSLMPMSLRGYQKSWFSGYLIAGATLAAVAIPECMGYTSIAGMPVVKSEKGREELQFHYNLGRPDIAPDLIHAGMNAKQAPRGRIERGGAGRKLVGSAQRRQRGAFLQHGALPLATDYALHARLFGLTPEEALRGATMNAARALGQGDRGRLAAGLRADFAVWDLEHPAELACRFGHRPCRRVVCGGRERP